jgi:hypothetical protein
MNTTTPNTEMSAPHAGKWSVHEQEEDGYTLGYSEPGQRYTYTPVATDLTKEGADRMALALNSHDALVDALLTALPFVEDAFDDAGYKLSKVQAAVRKIKAALAKAGA